uniref:SRPBCC family protein n=1 Tax=Nonomuraea pusilla TaxID=46177 RepID=UPI0006E449E5|nr:SRPBCC family protein [Nonomuraea pusilla]
MNENLVLHPDGRTSLRMQRRLPHPPDKVWRAITDPAHLARWFPAEVTIDGDRISYGFGPEGRITGSQAPRLFAHTWGDDELRWEIQPDGDGSLLTFTHTFADRHGAASFAAGWHTCVNALLAVLDDRPVRAPAGTARLHEDYVAILGLDPVTAADGAVRVERQLTRPADDVWRLLEGDRAEPGLRPPAPFTVPGVRAGAVTRVEPAKLLDYDTPCGTVRWELVQGTGHGARLVVTQTGDTDSGTAAAWRGRVEELASSLVD